MYTLLIYRDMWSQECSSTNPPHENKKSWDKKTKLFLNEIRFPIGENTKNHKFILSSSSYFPLTLVKCTSALRTLHLLLKIETLLQMYFFGYHLISERCWQCCVRRGGGGWESFRKITAYTFGRPGKKPRLLISERFRRTARGWWTGWRNEISAPWIRGRDGGLS